MYNNKKNSKISITPKTKISVLLEAYPELEETLIELSPAFSKLKNPVLRKTVAKVATLKQVAEIGNVKQSELITVLRRAAGQPEYVEENVHEVSSPKKKPEWVDTKTVVKTLDAKPILDKGDSPITMVLNELKELGAGELFELITPFLPSPLIQLVEKKGFRCWTIEETEDIYKTYISKL